MPVETIDVHAGRPRAGRRFEPVGELRLSDDALAAARTLPGSHRGVRVLVESAGPFGIPDLLAVVGPLHRLDERLALNVPPLLNQVDAGVIAAAAVSAPRTTATLARRLGWPEDTVATRVPYLMRVGALQRVSSDTYVRPEELRPIGRLLAIEAKLRDWRRAIQQARRYSVWSDGYVVVMPAIGPRSTHELIEAIDHDNAGLMLDSKWIRRPRLTQRSPAQRLWGSEHVIAAFG